MTVVADFLIPAGLFEIDALPDANIPWRRTGRGGRGGKQLGRSVAIPLGDGVRWNELIDWLEATWMEYTRVLREVLGAEV